MTDAPRFGKTKYATIRRDFNNLRDAINRHDALATEAAWEKCERWLEAIPTSDTIAALQAENAKLREGVTVKDAIRWLKLIRDQDQGCGGRLNPQEIYLAMKREANNALTAYRSTQNEAARTRIAEVKDTTEKRLAEMMAQDPDPDDDAIEVAKLREALTEIAGAKPHHAGQTVNEYHFQMKARAALSGQDAEGET